MKDNLTLVVLSLLSILLALVHITEDVVRGFERGGPEIFNAVLIAAVWLYAALVLVGRRSGYVLLLLLSIGGAGVSYIHMRGAGLAGGRIANSSGIFFWVFTLLTLGATSTCAAILAAQGLWKSLRGRSRRAVESSAT
jgi:hypothetical protein